MAEAASVRSAIATRTMGHTSYVSKAMLRRNAIELSAMRALVIRANAFNALPADVDSTVVAIIKSAEEASK